MCNDPYVPKANGNATSKISEAASYTSPFGEDQSEVVRPQTRAKARTNLRTPYVQSAPHLVPHLKRPRSRRKPQGDDDGITQPRDDSTSNSSFQMFLSLPNTPDTEDPLKIFHANRQFAPGLCNESYI